jgi:hypothetical protein
MQLNKDRYLSAPFTNMALPAKHHIYHDLQKSKLTKTPSNPKPPDLISVFIQTTMDSKLYVRIVEILIIIQSNGQDYLSIFHH